MAKKARLKNLVQGKGLDAMAATDIDKAETANEVFANSAVGGGSRRRNRQRSADLSVTKTEAQGEAQPEVILPEKELKKPEKANGSIAAIEPGECTIAALEDTVFDDGNFFVTLDAFTLIDEDVGAHFESGSTMTYKINCAASRLLVQLKAECKIEVIAYDARTMQPEQSYCLAKTQKIEHPFFQLTHFVKCSLKGLYKFHVILSITNADLFDVYHANYFQVV